MTLSNNFKSLFLQTAQIYQDKTMKFWVNELFVFHLRAMAMQQGAQGLLQARISQAHPKNERVKTEYSFFWSIFLGKCFALIQEPSCLWAELSCHCLSCTTVSVGPGTSLGDSTQLILLQCQLTDSLCNSWASLLFSAGFLMELWVTPNTILNFHVPLNKEL